MNNPQQKQPFQDVRNGINIFALVVNSYATAILPFIRKDFGTNFFGLNALVAVLVMIVFGAIVNSDDLLTYFGFWILLVTAHRLDAYRNARKGRAVHSRSAGDSWLAIKFLPKGKAKTLQMLAEPALCIGAGILFCPYSPGVGKFLVVGGFAVMMFNGLQRGMLEQRVRRMHDAHIEQQTTARVFRRQDDDF